MLEDPNRKRCYLYEMISKGSLRKHFLTKKLFFKLGNNYMILRRINKIMKFFFSFKLKIEFGI